MEDRKESQVQKRKIIIILSVIIILLAASMVVLVGMSLRSPKETIENIETEKQSNAMAYEANVVVGDKDSLQDAVDRLIEKAKEGQMSLEMKTEAYSDDGKRFTCHLANSIQNNYDMFMVLYLDNTQQEIYRTGLIPIGSRIEEFTLKEALEPGRYEATLVYNQVEEDRETIHAQVNVGLVLVVK